LAYTSEPAKGCPLNVQDCPVDRELRRLREEIDRLQELVRTDALTGYYNLRYFREALAVEMERTRRTGRSTSLIMIDLDRFKRINDLYGHEVGNRALRFTCTLWRENLRKIDIACRYGGEEFAVILPGTRLAQAISAAERLRSSLEARRPNLNGQRIRLTASFGVDVYRGRTDLNVEDFLERTDRLLLEAKAKGRNRVIYDPDRAKDMPTEVTGEERRALWGAEDMEE